MYYSMDTYNVSTVLVLPKFEVTYEGSVQIVRVISRPLNKMLYLTSNLYNYNQPIKIYSMGT